jgi:adenine-specific DNA-methyltransferase
MSQDIVAENINQLRYLFPEAWTEGKIDFDVLKQLLGEHVDDHEEKFGLNWHGKRDARRLALTTSLGTLLPYPTESVNWNETQNLVIEGDNLEVLKLLQKSYAGKVKLIYIDPPYNTGNDFVYKDDFRDSIKNYFTLTGQTEGGTKVTSNTESSGRFHTDWLNMIFPRLKIARNLLRSDGAIFITADDGEIANLLLLCNDVFGEENFRSCISWQKKYSVSNNFKGIASIRDHLVVYSKSESFENGLIPRDDESRARYQNPDNDPRGPWKPVDYWNMASPEDRPNLVYPIRNPNTDAVVNPEKKAWKFSPEVHERHVSEGRIWWGVNGTNRVPALKLFLSDVKDGLIPHNWWPHEDAGHTDEAKKELDRLFGGSAPFDTPKPIRLLRRIFQVGGLGTNDLVMDFFAGSGTTGHAIYEANSEDDGRRRFILIQLPEQTENKQFQTIADITTQRLRLASKSINDANSSIDCDLGFRLFKLSESNITIWNPKPDNLSHSLLSSVEHINPSRDEESVLYELVLKLGLDLCTPIETRSINEKIVHSIGAGALIVCLTSSITQNDVERLAQGIIEWHKQQSPAGETSIVFRDSAFADDVTKTNITAILQQHGLANVKSL